MFKVAILQKRAIHAQIDKNIESIIMAMKEASENQADILLMPECFITGYDLPMSYEKSIADEKNVESGKEFKVCDFEGTQLGIMICYDREYPEIARILMLKGAEVILVPNDCGSMQPRVSALSTRAYENMVAVAMANPNGDNAGCSCAFNPICWDRNGNCVDNTVLLADDKTEGILYAEFDMEAIREYRNREMLGNTFRKVEAYSQLLSKEIKKPFIRDGQNR